MPLSKSIQYPYLPTSKKTLGGANLFIFQHKQTVVKVGSNKIKRIEILDCRWQTRQRSRLVGDWVMIDRKVDRANQIDTIARSIRSKKAIIQD